MNGCKCPNYIISISSETKSLTCFEQGFYILVLSRKKSETSRKLFLTKTRTATPSCGTRKRAFNVSAIVVRRRHPAALQCLVTSLVSGGVYKIRLLLPLPQPVITPVDSDWLVGYVRCCFSKTTSPISMKFGKDVRNRFQMYE